MKNYYETMKLKSDASEKEIRRAYIKLAAEIHPDKNPDVGSEAFQELGEAYAILSDSNKRSKYDRELQYYLKSQHTNPQHEINEKSENRKQPENEFLKKYADLLEKINVRNNINNDPTANTIFENYKKERDRLNLKTHATKLRCTDEMTYIIIALRDIADKGHLNAAFELSELGLLFEASALQHILRNEIFYWTKKAAAAGTGHPIAAFKLAAYYLNGEKGLMAVPSIAIRYASIAYAHHANSTDTTINEFLKSRMDPIAQFMDTINKSIEDTKYSKGKFFSGVRFDKMPTHLREIEQKIGLLDLMKVSKLEQAINIIVILQPTTGPKPATRSPSMHNLYATLYKQGINALQTAFGTDEASIIKLINSQIEENALRKNRNYILI